jgi:hypothetical protein
VPRKGSHRANTIPQHHTTEAQTKRGRGDTLKSCRQPRHATHRVVIMATVQALNALVVVLVIVNGGLGQLCLGRQGCTDCLSSGSCVSCAYSPSDGSRVCVAPKHLVGMPADRLFGCGWVVNSRPPPLPTPSVAHGDMYHLRASLMPRAPHSALCTPHSALRTPYPTLRTPSSALRAPCPTVRTPHSALRTPYQSSYMTTVNWLRKKVKSSPSKPRGTLTCRTPTW